MRKSVAGGFLFILACLGVIGCASPKYAGLSTIRDEDRGSSTWKYSNRNGEIITITRDSGRTLEWRAGVDVATATADCGVEMEDRCVGIVGVKIFIPTGDVSNWPEYWTYENEKFLLKSSSCGGGMCSSIANIYSLDSKFIGTFYYSDKRGLLRVAIQPKYSGGRVDVDYNLVQQCGLLSRSCR